MRINRITTGLVVASGLVLAAVAAPANAASNCGSMFIKAEKMVATKGTDDVAKKVKGYQMAIDGYQTCAKALAMNSGAAQDTMMKKAEGEFKAAYDFIDGIE